MSNDVAPLFPSADAAKTMVIGSVIPNAARSRGLAGKDVERDLGHNIPTQI